MDSFCHLIASFFTHFKYNKTWATDHLSITTSSLWSHLELLLQKQPEQRPLFLGPEGGRCTQVWQYNNNHWCSFSNSGRWATPTWIQSYRTSVSLFFWFSQLGLVILKYRNIFLCFKHSSLTIKNRIILSFMKKKFDSIDSRIHYNRIKVKILRQWWILRQLCNPEDRNRPPFACHGWKDVGVPAWCPRHPIPDQWW